MTMIILQHLPYGETENNFQKKAVAKFRCGGFVAVGHAVSPTLVEKYQLFQARMIYVKRKKQNM